MRRAYSLLELLVVVAVMMLMAGLSLPLLTRALGDARFLSFVAGFSGDLAMARCYAQISGLSVSMDLAVGEGIRYRVYVRDQEVDRTLVISRDQGSSLKIGNNLPADVLPHPVSGGAMKSALKSTHKPEIIFGERGAGAATVVFSDRGGRAVCAVVSSRTGRFRVYVWDRRAGSWLDYY